MICPEEIRSVLLGILRSAILRIRAAAWQGDARRCALEADHVHNLPGVLNEFTHEGLRYYVDIEMPAYISQCEAARINDFEQFQPSWRELREQVDALAQPA